MIIKSIVKWSKDFAYHFSYIIIVWKVIDTIQFTLDNESILQLFSDILEWMLCSVKILIEDLLILTEVTNEESIENIHNEFWNVQFVGMSAVAAHTFSM